MSNLCTGSGQEIHVGDVGTMFIATLVEDGVALDISAATTLEVVFAKPDGTAATRTAVFYSDGTDGKIRYATITGDLDQDGKWKVQAYVEMPSWSGHSDIATFRVYSNLS